MPFACKLPKICDGLWSWMLFHTTEAADGWLKIVFSPVAMLKLCQFSTALLPALMVSVEPLSCIEAAPLWTVMPVGFASTLSVKLKTAAAPTARHHSESRRKTFRRHRLEKNVFIKLKLATDTEKNGEKFPCGFGREVGGN